MKFLMFRETPSHSRDSLVAFLNVLLTLMDFRHPLNLQALGDYNRTIEYKEITTQSKLPLHHPIL